MTPLLKTEGQFVWSGEIDGSSNARSVYFGDGSSHWDDRVTSSITRAFAVRSRQQTHSQKVEVASIPQKSSYAQPATSTSNAIKRDGIHVAYANGIVKDTNTGLEWKAGPDRDTDWNEARSWVQSLGGGWRMPTMDELEGLYNAGKGDRNMTSLLKTTGWWVWSGEAEGSSSARPFNFYSGHRNWRRRGSSKAKRAFAVRSRSDG